MAFTLDTLSFQNTGDVGTDITLSMSAFDGAVYDGAWIELEWDTASDFSNPTQLPEDNDMGLFPDDGKTSSTRRITNLPSDAQIYIRANATALNWEESTTYDPAFTSSGFVDDYEGAGSPGSGFNVRS